MAHKITIGYRFRIIRATGTTNNVDITGTTLVHEAKARVLAQVPGGTIASYEPINEEIKDEVNFSQNKETIQSSNPNTFNKQNTQDNKAEFQKHKEEVDKQNAINQANMKALADEEEKKRKASEVKRMSVDIIERTTIT